MKFVPKPYNKSIYSKVRTLAIFLIIAIWVSVSAFLFYREAGKYEENEIANTMSIVANNNARAVESQMLGLINTLKISAMYFSDLEEGDEYFERALNEITHIESFTKMVVVLPSGKSYETDGNSLILSDYEYTDEMNLGEVFISDLFRDETSDIDAISINVPMLDNNQNIVAYLVGVVSEEDLSNYFNSLLYDIGGYYYVVDNNGNYVATSNGQNMLALNHNFFDLISSLNFDNGYSSQDIIDSFNDRTENISKYSNNEGESRTAYFTPIEINNWIMYSSIDQDQIDSRVRHDLQMATIFIASITAVFTLLGLWVKRIQDQLIENASTYERNFKIVSDEINKFLIEFDLKKGEIKIIGNYKDAFNRSSDITLINEDVKRGSIFPEDAHIVTKSIDKLKKGEKLSDIRIRIRTKGVAYKWFSVSLIPIKSDRETIDKAIGFLEDIDKMIQENISLREKSELDSLTNVYNKGTTETKIKEVIQNADKEKDTHILFAIDIDNFKELNDTFGHQYGDEVIKEIATNLKSMFRPDDIVGRIGGDEFFAFMKGVNSDVKIRERADKICNVLDKTYKKAEREVKITASVGISEFPKNSTTFEELYQNADLALYSAKTGGKNKYNFYNGETHVNYVSNRTDIESEKTEN